MLIAAIGDHATASVAYIGVQDLLGGSCSESCHTPIQQIAVEHRRRYRYRRISAELRRRARLSGRHFADGTKLSGRYRTNFRIQSDQVTKNRVFSIARQPSKHVYATATFIL